MFHKRRTTLAPWQSLQAGKNRRSKRRGSPGTVLFAISSTLLVGCASSPMARWFSRGHNEHQVESASVDHGSSYNQSAEADWSWTHDQTDGTPQYFTENTGYNDTFNHSTRVDLSRTYDQTDSVQNYFTDKAGKNGLSQKYVSEARIGMTEVDVIRPGPGIRIPVSSSSTKRCETSKLPVRR